MHFYLCVSVCVCRLVFVYSAFLMSARSINGKPNETHKFSGGTIHLTVRTFYLIISFPILTLYMYISTSALHASNMM